VTVYGQVGQQGKLLMPQTGVMTISEAILQSGGFAQFAEKKKVKILRRIGRGPSDLLTIFVNVDAIMRKGRLEYDIPVRPNDVIIVGEKILNF
jgi:protein involved in polysaccharide export with SLBB domain